MSTPVTDSFLFGDHRVTVTAETYYDLIFFAPYEWCQFLLDHNGWRYLDEACHVFHRGQEKDRDNEASFHRVQDEVECLCKSYRPSALREKVTMLSLSCWPLLSSCETLSASPAVAACDQQASKVIRPIGASNSAYRALPSVNSN
jgi:hypothetical protein